MSERYIVVKKGVLTFYDSDGEKYLYKITSGWVGYTDHTVEGRGPIPPGYYDLYPEQITCDLNGKNNRKEGSNDEKICKISNCRSFIDNM